MDRWYPVLSIAAVALLGAGLYARLYGQRMVVPDMRYNDVLALQQQEGVTIVDVRQRNEWQASGVIEGSYLAEMAMLLDALKGNHAQLPEELKHKENTFLVVCRSGRRSALVANAMMALGYQRVYHLQGGLMHWQQSGGKVVDYASSGVTLWYAS